MGRDGDGSYMVGADGSFMRSGPKGKIMVAADGTTLKTGTVSATPPARGSSET